jgi:hypothetical protein
MKNITISFCAALLLTGQVTGADDELATQLNIDALPAYPAVNGNNEFTDNNAFITYGPPLTFEHLNIGAKRTQPGE